VFLATDARKRMAELGYKAPKSNYAKHTIMGKTVRSDQAEAYLKSFKIRK
jgi:nitrate/nitrite transport system substrate-binding protein